MESFKYTNTYKKDHNAPEKERKHMILLDGTWNDETGLKADGMVTNIVALNKIFVDDPEKQIVRYHRGVGNDNENRWIGQTWHGATGKSVGKIVEQAYARFVQEWQSGDHIYIFGFSRGAAAARMLAAKISRMGVPAGVTITFKPRQNAETKVVEQIMTNVVYDNSSKKDLDIEFVGVWDTVSAFGLANNVRRFIGLKTKDLFTNSHIAPNIKRAVHLVAIDETRNPFIPSLMNHKEGVTHEVWFPGVHSDIGGSYVENNIAKVSLHYMWRQLENWNKERRLQDFSMDQEELKKNVQAEIEVAYFHFHGKSFGKSLRTIGVQVDGVINPKLKPKIHSLYYKIASKKNSFSVVEIEEDDERKVTKFAPFQYMPFNVKMLNNHFDIVE